MKIKYALMAALLAVAPYAANAGINVQWFVGYGIYPFGAPDVTSVDAGTGLLANNVTGSTLIQLIYSAGGNAVAVDPLNGANGFVGAGNTVLQEYTVTTGVGGYDDWVFNSTIPSPFTDATFTPGSVFARVFYDATPGAGENYYDSALLTLQDRQLDFAFRQTLTFEPDANTSGVALNLTIVPEPSVMAFLGIGGLVLAARRRIRNA